MIKKIGILLSTLIIATFILIPTYNVEAASSVRVSLPTFKVNLNGVNIDNSSSMYPLIVYNEITYFPMTYYDSRFMGLESLWNSDSGLTIAKIGVNWEFRKYEAPLKNNMIYNAQIAPFKITVNGKKIDNSKEKYPLLLFRNITYFPLTWRFAVDEFGWKYTFDRYNGLVINSTSNPPFAGQLELPIVTRENGEKGAFTMAGNYFYYEGSNGIIYQASVSNPAIMKKVYQLPKSSYGSAFVYANLKTENGRALLGYHTGGATMGSNHLIWLKEDGTVEELDSGYSVMKIYDDYKIRVNQGVPPFQNNLQIKSPYDTDYKSVGNVDYLYGWIWSFNNDTKSFGGKPSEDLYLINDNIYILGYYDKEKPDSTTGIYKVNINTNETERVCEESASGFKIIDNEIYFTGSNNELYHIPIEGGNAVKITNEAVSHFNVLNESIYYSLKDKNNQLYIYGNNESVNPGGILKSLEVQNGYMVAVFDKSSESQYKMMIFNKNGRAIYKTIENVLLVRIENGKVVFVKDN